MSLSLATRPTEAAARPVIPEPANMSTTTSSGLVKASTNGLIASTGTFVR
jgi:hypothetical protein